MYCTLLPFSGNELEVGKLESDATQVNCYIQLSRASKHRQMVMSAL